MKSAATGITTGWQPDPYGEHEFRLFSPEGSPTAHVRTEGRHSYDEVPGAVIVDPPRAGSHPTSTDHAPRPPAPSATRPHAAASSGNRREWIGDVRTHVLVHQLARLVAALALLTTRDRTRPLRLAASAFSAIFLAAASARRGSLERSRPPLRATTGTS